MGGCMFYGWRIEGVGGTEALVNVFSADITTSVSLGLNHIDLANATDSSWKPSFLFEILPTYDPEKDSYVTIGYGVGASAALNQTALDPGFGTGDGARVNFGSGSYVWESTSVIPEPSTALLMGLGLAGLAEVRRR